MGAVREKEYFQLFQLGGSQVASVRKGPLSQALNGERKPLIQTSEGGTFQVERKARAKALKQGQT